MIIRNDKAAPAFCSVLVMICLLLSLTLIPAGWADRIYLKDGTIVESDKVWQSEDHVHFVLNGTQGVVIRYAKEIVSKIETKNGSKQVGADKKPSKGPRPGNIQIDKPRQPVPRQENKTATTTKAPQKSQSISRQDESFISTNQGLSFYDPRRKKRYWASRNSKHDTLNNALQAIAKLYNRPQQWVADNMGEENNLSAIHTNLIKRRNAETSKSAGKKESSGMPKQLLFSEGRKYPYHIGPGQDYQTRIEALDALARQYHQSPEWVRRQIGNHNDLNKIHQLLSSAKKIASNDAPKAIEPTMGRQPQPRIPEGLLFYNPRRDQKYWTGKLARHNTLKEALQALAKQYGVSVDWVEAHMGNTNDLSTIHRNIEDSLK